VYFYVFYDCFHICKDLTEGEINKKKKKNRRGKDMVYKIHNMKTGHTAVAGHQSVAFVISWKFWSTFNAEVKTVNAVAPYH
jgi:hypothetical protein